MWGLLVSLVFGKERQVLLVGLGYNVCWIVTIFSGVGVRFVLNSRGCDKKSLEPAELVAYLKAALNIIAIM